MTSVVGARIRAADGGPQLADPRAQLFRTALPVRSIASTPQTWAGWGLAWFFDFPHRPRHGGFTDRGRRPPVRGRHGCRLRRGHAFDAKSGALLWHHDPGVPRQWAVHLCCDAVNRGVMSRGGKVFVGTLDGRLRALDATDGKVLWSVQTTPRDKPYSITGARAW
ncbi:MAG: PQQ-binding-like beta-propeller repeat protein [Gammaproteobacteria bacterium]|nr:PQQ-binding-like beta-propeller repeat protein [Gammaproteobacteria bacterium]